MRKLSLIILGESRQWIGIVVTTILGIYTILSLVVHDYVASLHGSHEDVYEFVDNFQIPPPPPPSKRQQSPPFQQQQQQQQQQQLNNDNNNHQNNKHPDFSHEDNPKRRMIRTRLAQNEHAREVKRNYELEFPPDDSNRIRTFVYQNLRRPEEYRTQADLPYDIYHCPRDGPPPQYPWTWNVMDVLMNWNASQTTEPERLYQSICVWDYETDLSVARLYRDAEVPFLLRNTPSLLQASERWNRNPEYLSLLFQDIPEKVEHSTNNHFMFFKIPPGNRQRLPPGWTPPMEITEFTFQDWYDKAKTVTSDQFHQDRYYFRSKAVPDAIDAFLYEELPIFKPVDDNFFMVQPEQQRGINCRFGMKGVMAETHFDESRNFIVLLGGQRRYILAHPRECPNLYLYPSNHPSGRHSAVDWIHPNLTQFPDFIKAQVQEVVLQAGDALYLPTMWFHFIVSLNINYQCNARSGTTNENLQFIQQCGFKG
jgi:hypothetical protein